MGGGYAHSAEAQNPGTRELPGGPTWPVQIMVVKVMVGGGWWVVGGGGGGAGGDDGNGGVWYMVYGI